MNCKVFVATVCAVLRAAVSVSGHYVAVSLDHSYPQPPSALVLDSLTGSPHLLLSDKVNLSRCIIMKITDIRATPVTVPLERPH